MADLGQFPFKVRGVDLADTARIDAKGPAVSILDTAVFPEDRQVAAGGSFDVTGTAAGSVIVSGTAPGTLAFSGAAVGGVQVSAGSSGLLDLGGVAVGAVADTALPPIQLVHVDDAPSWKSLFYKRLDDLDEALDEVVAAEEPQQVAAEIVAEFTPADVPDAMPKLAGMLASLAEAGKRKAIERQARAIQAEIKRAKDERRRRMNNEAALLLLVA